VIVLMRGMLLHAYTRIYFDDETDANARDDVLAQVPAERRGTLIAKREAGTSKTIYRFDIHSARAEGNCVLRSLSSLLGEQAERPARWFMMSVARTCL
jgi:protocatechuate 3,4-dioxygenase beta subunit